MPVDPDDNDGDTTRGPDENDETMMRGPDDDEAERQYKGGRAAERLRQHLEERFGDEAPPIPPDEEEQPEEEAPSEPADDATDRDPGGRD